MEKMWLIVGEILSNSDRPSGAEIGFVKITTWADSKESASSKIEGHLNSFGWHLMQIEEADIIKADIIRDHFVRADEVTDRSREYTRQSERNHPWNVPDLQDELIVRLFIRVNPRESVARNLTL